MTKRKIITINEKKCTGCGLCIPNCPEGALQIIDGKARLISDIFCDGLGACIGHCPEGAITVEERNAEKYNEKKVMENIIKAGKNTIIAHLNHLKDHGETEYLNEALEVLKEKNIEVELETKKTGSTPCTCPSAQTVDFSDRPLKNTTRVYHQESQLRQWPIQLHLISPQAPYYKNKDVLLTADCVAYALGEYHSQYLSGKSIAIACPKLDSNTEQYIEKIRSLIDDAHITSLTVMIMEVPCCRGLVAFIQQALEKTTRNIPLHSIVVGIQGNILKEEEVYLLKKET
ncbi:MAG: 4Fe-4S binding protein [Candidatus Thermoplasmatota archaeon]